MWKVLLKAAVSGLLIWFLVSRTDLRAVIDQVLSIGADGFLWIVLILLALVPVAAFRWLVIMGGGGKSLNFAGAVRIVMIGNFFNQTLPSSIGGDAVRMWEARRAGLGLGLSVNSVLLDRFAALIAICLIIGATSPVTFSLIDDPAARWGLVTVAVGGLSALGLLLILDRMPASLLRWRLTRGIAALSADGRRVFLTPRYATATILTSVVIQVTVAMVVFLIARNLALPVSVLECVVLVPPVMLVTALPISIAGWGVREGAMVTAFGFVGVAAADALAMSVLFGIATVCMSLPGGVLWLFTKPRRGAGDRPVELHADPSRAEAP